MFVTFIISWPLAKLLDCMLGTEHSTFFRHAELKVLVDLHGTNAGTDGPLSGDEVMVIKVKIALYVIMLLDHYTCSIHVVYSKFYQRF